MRVGGESEPAVLLRNDHREEFARFQKLPDLRRQVVPFPIDLPVVEHAAELFDGACEELLLLVRELRRREGQKLAPIGIAGEQLGIPPHVAGLDGFALGVGQARQRVLRQAKDRLGETIPPER